MSADRIRKLVTLAASAAGTPEGDRAAEAARRAIAGLDTELLDTLAGQRRRLMEQLREESQRLVGAGERATKGETGELVSSALALFGHYEKIDALIAAAMLLRLEGGHSLTDEERQQLDGPVDSFLDRWMAGIWEERRAKREERRRAARRR